LALLGFAPLQRNPDTRVHFPRAYFPRYVPASGLPLGTPSCRLAPLASSRCCSHRRAPGVSPSGLFPLQDAAARFRARFPRGGWLPKRYPPRFGFADGATATDNPRIVERSGYPALRGLLILQVRSSRLRQLSWRRGSQPSWFSSSLGLSPLPARFGHRRISARRLGVRFSPRRVSRTLPPSVSMPRSDGVLSLESAGPSEVSPLPPPAYSA